MRKKIVAGNWKMNMNKEEAKRLWQDLKNASENFGNVEVIVAPPSVYLAQFAESISEGILLSAQNVHSKDNGAYTGEISAEILKSLAVKYTIVGHSERRLYFGEKDKDIALKIDKCLNHGVKPIYCCGEIKEEREAGEHFAIVGEQVKNALFHLSREELAQLVVAYEPVWAIGTGLTATSDQAQEMHKHIRMLIESKFGNSASSEMRILYGGSCKPANASELFSQPDVDGGLIGGASLNASDFAAIIKAAQR